MKNDLKFYDSLPLFLTTIIFMWSISFSLIYVFIITFDLQSVIWWLAIFLVYGMSIITTIMVYFRTMAKIIFNEDGIKKFIFRKNIQYIRWGDIGDVKILTRPNGYSYIVISIDQINVKKFEEVIRTKKYIYFSYNKKAIELINNKIK